MSNQLSLERIRKKIASFNADYEHAIRSVKDEKVALKHQRKRVRNAVKAQSIVQIVAQGVQQQAHDQIAKVVTKCLQTVYQEPYEFKIEFLKKRGKTEARLTFLRNGKEEDPMDGSGGGAVDVAAFALRLACIILQRPHRRKLIVMDEPFKFVNGEGFQERAGEMMKALAGDLDFQFIIVTDDDWLKIGKVISL